MTQAYTQLRTCRRRIPVLRVFLVNLHVIVFMHFPWRQIGHWIRWLLTELVHIFPITYLWKHNVTHVGRSRWWVILNKVTDKWRFLNTTMYYIFQRIATVYVRFVLSKTIWMSGQTKMIDCEKTKLYTCSNNLFETNLLIWYPYIIVYSC